MIYQVRRVLLKIHSSCQRNLQNKLQSSGCRPSKTCCKCLIDGIYTGVAEWGNASIYFPAIRKRNRLKFNLEFQPI